AQQSRRRSGRDHPTTGGAPERRRGARSALRRTLGSKHERRRQTPTAPLQQVRFLAPPQVAGADEPEPNDQARERLWGPESDVERAVSRLDHARALAVVARAGIREVPERARHGPVPAFAGTPVAKGEDLRRKCENRHQGHERDFLDHADTSFLGVGITQASCRTVSNRNKMTLIAGSAEGWPAQRAHTASACRENGERGLLSGAEGGPTTARSPGDSDLFQVTANRIGVAVAVRREHEVGDASVVAGGLRTAPPTQHLHLLAFPLPEDPAERADTG